VVGLRHVLNERPNLFKALIVDSFVHASITQQWLANIGGRSALSRTAHLLCEFAVRVGRHGEGGVVEYELPLTQTELAEVLGLTLVHTNRTLKQLAVDGLIDRKRERLRIIDITGLEAVADFSARYLHLDRSLRDRRRVRRPV
jgi:CRP-like cAMP-binding protein